MMTRTVLALLATAALATAAQAAPAGVQRKQTPEGAIASSALVPAGTQLIWLSGQTASPANPADPNSIGDTEAQTLNIFTKMKAQLAEYGLGMGDVVKLNLFMVGDPKTGGLADRAGMTKSYLKFFGTPEQPNKPTRTTVQITALGRPGVFIEIEAVVAKTR